MNRKTIAWLMFGATWAGAFFSGSPIMPADPKDNASAKINPAFDSKSFWYTPIEDNVVLHPDSKKLVEAFKRQKAAGKDNIVGINTTSYASPVYIAKDDAATIAVDLKNCFGFGDSEFKTLLARVQAVPIPEKAAPACGDDSEMTIYQPSTDTMWEFARASKDKETGRWHACWGGRMDHVSKSNGIWPNPFGATATGLPFAGGQITAEELEAGEIKHVIGIALVQADRTYSWPATRSDGEGCGGGLCIPEGLRFRLDPSVKVEQLEMHPVGKIIAKAAQKYGFVVWDKAATTSLRAKNPKSYTQLGADDSYGKLFAPKDQWTVLEGFPWDKLQFLPVDYGKRRRPTALNTDDSQAESQQVDELLGRWISKTGPGVAVLVVRDHKKLYEKGYGLAKLGHQVEEPITPTTNFRLASLTKQFTGMAIAMLIEQKKLKLDDRLSDFFPDQSAREIRIRHLLHHTSGLREYEPLFRQFGMIDAVDFQSANSYPPSFEPKNSDVHNLLKGQTLLHYPPGRVFKYNNSGYVYLASIIEKVSGMSYGEFLNKHIFAKLQMANTYVGDGQQPHDPRLAHSYDFRGVGTSTNIDYSPLNKIYGEDGVFSNLEDLFQWDQALYCARDQVPPARQLVSDATLDLIFRPDTLTDGTVSRYGFGWFVMTNGVGVYHYGSWAGYRTYIRRYLNDHISIIVLSNLARVDVEAVADGIDNIYYPQ